MTNVVAFPSPMSNQRTPIAIEVVVAPLCDLWVAWLRLPTGYYTALERTPDEWHALRDARAYAARHNIPVTVHSKPLAVVLDQPQAACRGEISIWPDPDGGGCWRVDHVSASGDSAAIVGSAFSFGEAVTIARDAAARLSANFDDPFSNFGGAA
ncbi:hypothetical protein [Methylobacterium sp. J-070]|uniref:hypothetical protein n=1 Tax=Methylobacterium sp. J-070 TaxID=2836650 RepID=UPI001FB89D7F|nr:hypothetical protein [Methylobacterium sp. J-070]MCJ2052611.1 hypothetical protein [Methylobacterium sp. J-070]